MLQKLSHNRKCMGVVHDWWFLMLWLRVFYRHFPVTQKPFQESPARPRSSLIHSAFIHFRSSKTLLGTRMLTCPTLVELWFIRFNCALSPFDHLDSFWSPGDDMENSVANQSPRSMSLWIWTKFGLHMNLESNLLKPIWSPRTNRITWIPLILTKSCITKLA